MWVEEISGSGRGLSGALKGVRIWKDSEEWERILEGARKTGNKVTEP